MKNKFFQDLKAGVEDAILHEKGKLWLRSEPVQMKKCSKDHTPNTVTEKTLESVKSKKALQKVDTVEELFAELDQ